MKDLLAELFANVPVFNDEVVGGLGKELNEATCYTGDGPDPIKWMETCGIRYVHEQAIKSRPGYITYGRFKQADTLEECVIQLNPNHSNLTDPLVVRTLWHEIGHAIDHVGVMDGMLYICPHQYSTAHAEPLKECAPLIVGLRLEGSDPAYEDGSWNDYAHSPSEVWAEAVSIAVCRPDVLKPTKLWPVLAATLNERGINLPAPASPEVEAMAPKQPVHTGHGEPVGKAAEGAGKPLPAPSPRSRGAGRRTYGV